MPHLWRIIMAYQGAGAPPPKTGAGGNFKNTKPVYYLSEKVTGKNGAELKLVRGLKVQVDERDRPIVTLDAITSLDDCYTINMHVFNLRGTKDNMVVCPKTEADPRPCPICNVFNKPPTWFVCLSCIDRSKWSPPEGKNKNIVYTDNRRLVLISNTRKSTMQLYIDKASGTRGSKWTVSRSKPSDEIGRDGQKYTSFKNSPRIGDLWFPNGKMTEEEMKKDFEKAASTYGLAVEAFVKPFDYNFVLKPKDHKQLLAIANDIKDDPTALKDQASKSSDDEDVSDSATPAAPANANAEADIKY
jgi:hypothetical protein